ncbi:MAG: N-acetylmuramoyl-L-alanine amidase [Acidobacteriaceae bacterium]|nr:N-acetylmuramoyl-L-alanine amidase [Acidobacteriaceae bacterium]
MATLTLNKISTAAAIFTLCLFLCPSLAAQSRAAKTPAHPKTIPSSRSASTTPRPVPAFYRNVIVLDPAHGGTDTGAVLDDGLLEKNVVLSFSARLRTALTTAGFTVLTTRDNDSANALSAGQRAGIANHARPLACLLLHATGSGSGVHIVTSDLPAADRGNGYAPRRWQTAQATSILESLTLAGELSAAFKNAKPAPKLSVVQMRASVPPIDNLISAAVAIEIAPASRTVAVTNDAYQQRIVAGIVKALTAFRAEHEGTGE